MRAGMSSLKGWAVAALGPEAAPAVPCGISPRNPPQGLVLGCGGCPSTRSYSAMRGSPFGNTATQNLSNSIKDLALKRSYLFLISLNGVAAVAFHFYPINCSVLCSGSLFFNLHPLLNILQWGAAFLSPALGNFVKPLLKNLLWEQGGIRPGICSVNFFKKDGLRQ